MLVPTGLATAPSLTRTARLRAPADHANNWAVAPPLHDDVGSEILPDYCPCVTKSGSVSYKHEFTGPFSKAYLRTWHTGTVFINNTQIIITPTLRYMKPYVFTLQYAEVGLAFDHDKQACTLRFRAEGQQFLLEYDSIEECLDWITAIQTGIDVSLPLDLRTIPEVRRNHRHYNGWDVTTTSEDDIKYDLERDVYDRTLAASPQSSTSSLLADASRRSRSSSNASTLSTLSLSSASSRSSTSKSSHRFQYDLRDFRHLRQKSSWQGKKVLHNGRWNIVDNNTLYEIL